MDELIPSPAAGTSPGKPAAGAYRVLARKYRPTTFAEVIGQDALVRTLTNAIASGRLAHAFMLTGVRGVGKTTTARIIARALNCVGPDGTGGPTPSPCGQCEPCRAIAADRHVDVLEMDAASRTGVDDMREIIDGVRYRPSSARYKIYIIDEVHMLSRHAFNALLKTLEEPPEHTKFVFATTEIRKVPVTVLSRCQRFDLRRVDMERLAEHFGTIARKEGASITAAALTLIARAADGSVRDGLSLLDQAISMEGAAVGEEDIRRMLGLVDRGHTFDLFDAVMRGDVAGALDRLAAQHADGADPTLILEDLLDLTHWLTRIKVAPQAADHPGTPETDRVRGRALSDNLSMAVLTRAWQMLLKGLEEVRQAPSGLQAAEMVLVRLGYAADLPPPAALIKTLRDGGAATAAGAAAVTSAAAPAPSAMARPPAGGADKPASGPPPTVAAQVPSLPAPSLQAIGGGRVALATALLADESPAPEPLAAPRADNEPPPPELAPWDDDGAVTLHDPATFQAVIDLADALREVQLYANLRNNVHLVGFEPGRIEFRPAERAPADLAHALSRFLNAHTVRRWVVTVSRETGAPTLQQQAAANAEAAKAKAASHPLVRSVMEAFPGASIAAVRSLAPPPEKLGGDADDGPPAETSESPDP